MSATGAFNVAPLFEGVDAMTGIRTKRLSLINIVVDSLGGDVFALEIAVPIALAMSLKCMCHVLL